MTSLSNKSAADIVSEHSSTVEVFEKHHLDYCNLKEPLKKMLEGKALLKLLEELELTIAQEPKDHIDYTRLSVAELSKIIRNEYHEFLREKISELTMLSQKISARYKKELPEKIHEQLLAIFDNLAPHMLQEEKVLFPYLEYMEHMVEKGKIPRPPSFGKITKTVSSMLDDHTASTERLNKLRSMTNNYTSPSKAGEELQTFYHELHQLDRNLRMHIHLENNVLFKKARVLEAIIKNN